MEQGLYLLCEAIALFHTNYGCSTINGFKIRELFVEPNAHDHKYVYAVNFEFSVNRNYWEPRTISSEIRPILVGCTCINGVLSTTQLSTRTTREDLVGCSTTRRGEWLTTSMTGGRLRLKSTTGLARSTDSLRSASNFMKSGLLRITLAVSFWVLMSKAELGTV